MNVTEVQEFLDTEFPQMNHGGKTFSIESVRPRGAVVRMQYHDRHIRPGGTISGPSMMALADYAMYVALLAGLGPVALAVTTNLSINFLRKPGPRDMLADCEVMKLGSRLAVGEVRLTSEGSDEIVAHVVCTYAIPPEK
ncbi:PaaI family thioesterase [Microbaculum marinum]|uniref:PaaI family thioesterase n=1 Tax=Microbaculum marinum TaxID=1764581 RepID=A0AAW9S0R1_9HYPH